MLDLSQQHLAAAAGLTFQQVQKYETGSNRMSAGRLFQFSRLLRVSIPWFYEGIEATTRIGGDEQEFLRAMNDGETRRLAIAYSRISSPALRRRIRAFASAMVKDH